MLEAEMCFIEDLNDVMDLIENMLRIVTKALNSTSVREELRAVSAAYGNQLEGEHKFDHLKMLTQRWDGLMAPDWPRITYAEAFEVLEAAHELKKAEFEFPPPYENGLQAEHERFIATTIGQGRPVFVTDYPRAQKPFYMSPSLSTKESRGTADTVACFDLLVPDLCELAGGSLREHRSKELLEAMKEKGVEGNNLEWYQDLRKYGSTPHGGFGLGFDRLICYLAGVQNVRDVVAFPRWYGRCDC
jgi:asparaginyl-tRNA synthetase